MHEDQHEKSQPRMSMPPVAPVSPDPDKVRPRRKKGVIVAMLFAAVVVLGAIFAVVYRF